LWQCLQKRSWGLAILTGIIAGLAHLTKASVLPGLVIFLGLAGAKWAWTTFLRNHHSLGDAKFIKSAYSDLFAIFLVGVFFLITVFPYIHNSKLVFGHYFYNVNTTFYIWYDSWEQAEQGTRAHGDRVGWPDMPAEEIPSMSKYFREHTSKQIGDRLLSGAKTVIISAANSYGYFKYVVIYLSLFTVAILWFWQRASEIVISNPLLCLFLILYFGGYFLLYSWYAPIADSNRFILSQFIPFMFAISYGLETLLRSSQVKVSRRPIDTLLVANLAVLLLVVVDIYFVLTERVGAMYGGY
jgi:hypothetical protein